jgi:excisionase family DNA binding protein
MSHHESPDPGSEYMTTDDFAKLVHAPPETIRYWVFIGKAPKSIRVGRRRLWKHSDVLAWLEEQAKS